jgi:hypothetical protein
MEILALTVSTLPSLCPYASTGEVVPAQSAIAATINPK